MERLTREKAIGEFGVTVSVPDFTFPGLLPPFDYSGQLKLSQLQSVIKRWKGHENSLRVREGLGQGISALANPQNDWERIVRDEFAKGGKPTEAQIADVMRGHAVKAFNEARDEVIRLANKRQRASNWLVRLFNWKSVLDINSMPTGEEVFSGLKTEVDYIPDEIRVPLNRLKVGDKVYQVVDGISKEKGVQIVEHEIAKISVRPKTKHVIRPTAICSCEFDVVKDRCDYDVVYYVQDERGISYLSFCLADDGRFMIAGTHESSFNLPNYFLSRKDAQAKQDEIYDIVGRQLKARLNKGATPV